MLYFTMFPAFYTVVLVIRHEIHKNNVTIIRDQQNTHFNLLRFSLRRVAQVTDMELRKINLLLRKHYNQNRDLGKQTLEVGAM